MAESMPGSDAMAALPIDMDSSSFVRTTFLGRDMYFWVNIFVLSAFAFEGLLKIVIHGFVMVSGVFSLHYK